MTESAQEVKLSRRELKELVEEVDRWGGHCWGVRLQALITEALARKRQKTHELEGKN